MNKIRRNWKFWNCRRIFDIYRNWLLSASSLLSTDIFVYTQFEDTHKWLIENCDPQKLTPVRVFSINCKPPTPSLNSSEYQVGEISIPIQCSDRIAFEVGRVLLNLAFGNTPWFETALRNKGYCKSQNAQFDESPSKKEKDVSRPGFYKRRGGWAVFFLLFIISYCMLSLHIITFPQGYVGALRSIIKHQILIKHKFV